MPVVAFLYKRHGMHAVPILTAREFISLICRATQTTTENLRILKLSTRLSYEEPRDDVTMQSRKSRLREQRINTVARLSTMIHLGLLFTSARSPSAFGSSCVETIVCEMAQQQTILDEIARSAESATDRVTALTDKLSKEMERWSWDGAKQSANMLCQFKENDTQAPRTTMSHFLP